MSTSQQRQDGPVEPFGFGGGGRGMYEPLSRSELKRQKDDLYARTFGDLEPETIYRDPLGMRANRPVDLQRERWKQYKEDPVFPNGNSIIDEWNRLQARGFDVSQTVDIMQRSLDTGDWTLPLDIIPDVFMVNPEQLPMWDFLPRVATDDDEIVATPVTAFPDFGWGLESGAGDREYAFDDPTYGDLEYPVVGVGAATRISDKMILAADNLRDARGTEEQVFVRGAAQEVERQIILGTDNDADGFQGFHDLGDNADESITQADATDDTDGPQNVKDYTEDLIDQAETNGAPTEQIAIVCDIEWHRTLRRAFDDIQRVMPAEDVDVGFSTFAMEGGLVNVFKTHALPNVGTLNGGATFDHVVAVNMGAAYLGVLQELSIKDLGKMGPQERFALDSYLTLVDESDGDHIIVGQVETA